MTTRARWASALVVPVVALALAGCSTAKVSQSTTTSTPATSSSTTATTSPATTTSVAAAPTSTTVVLPTALQTSAEAAATVLVNAWAANNRARALLVAVPQAVNTLLAVHYPGSLAISRGCTSAFPPIICTYGPPGGGPTNAPIYQIHVTPASGGWYVSSVQIES